MAGQAVRARLVAARRSARQNGNAAGVIPFGAATLTQDAADVSPLATKSNEPIPGYHVRERLGAGGYGEVWTVEAPGQLLKAIKFVYGMLDEDRASRELKALNRIKGVRHPFLLSLERIEVVDGHLLIITELADGSLKDRYEECRKSGDPGIGREELICHLRDAADALDYMSDHHSLQHLDVKPENLLLVGGRVKVADFGLVKDIQDPTASMMGGLTPVYAPPEVFEGAPSNRSDQYSLAIVFQEMLTGVLPFPGKTAAQLAAQHLNAKPRLASLPSADQPVIARALAKTPAERFNSCRELINCLEQAGRNHPTFGSSAPPPSPIQTQGPPQFLAATEAGPAGHGVQHAPEQPRTTGDMFAQLEAASHAAAGALGDAAVGDVARQTGPVLEDAAPCIDLPPPTLQSLATPQQPTLFIGIGGTGGKVLQRLRRRLHDRGESAAERNYGMLLLDTDGRDLMRATHGDDGVPLTAEETLGLPLRRTQDYRNDTGKHLEWLSRRWLYNIPRSLQTEGLRPLGRLALADHAETVLARIRGALEQLWRVQQATAAEHGRSAVPPRVVLVTSLAGGTGSGMAVDVAYMARQMLDELSLTQSPVLAVFAHSTNRNPQAQELAAVNSFAALAELNQFHRPGGAFPGDFGCGLKAREGRALESAYVVQLGHELAPEQYHQACDQLAEFLFLDTASAARNVLGACRASSDELSQLAAPDFLVRTFGLCQLGVGQDPLIDRAAVRLCRSVLERWTGQPRQSVVKKTTHTFPRPNQVAATPHDTLAAKDTQLDTIAATQAATLGLDLDRLMQQLYQQAAKELEGNPDHCFRSIAKAFPPGQDGLPPVDRWIAAAAELFGTRHDAEGPRRISDLQSNLEDHARVLAKSHGDEARKWLEGLVDHPGARVYGAQRGAKWLQGHLKSLADKLRETRSRLTAEWIPMEQQLLAAARIDARQKQRSQAVSPETLLLQLCRVRLLEISAAAAGVLVQGLLAHLLAAQDGLTDLARELQNLVSGFTVDADEPAPPATDEMSTIKAAVAQQLKLQEDELAAQIDEALTSQFIAPGGGLRKALHSGETIKNFLDRLQTESRVAILRRLELLDFAALLLRPTTTAAPAQLPALLGSAQPKLQACGGQRRLICVLPTSSSVQSDDALQALQAEPRIFHQPAAVIRDSGSDVVLCFEIGDVSLSQVAAAIVDRRPDYVECAARIHTRADVAWQPLLHLKQL